MHHMGAKKKRQSGRRVQEKYRNLCLATKGSKINKGLRNTLLSTLYNQMHYDKESIIRAFCHKHHTQSTRSTASVSIPAVRLVNTTQHTSLLNLRLAITKDKVTISIESKYWAYKNTFSASLSFAIRSYQVINMLAYLRSVVKGA